MKQITVLSDKPESKDRLITDVTKLLSDAGISIDSIMGENYGQQSVVTLSVNDYLGALKTIEKRTDLQVMSEDALLVRVKDEPGALAKLSCRFSDVGISIRSIRFVERHEGYALVAIATERTKEALSLVKDILAG